VSRAEFFKKDHWAYPPGIWVDEKGQTRNDVTDEVIKVDKVLHTAACTSSHGKDADMHFAQAWMGPDQTLCIYVWDRYYDLVQNCIIHVQKDKCGAAYWFLTVAPDPAIWHVRKAELVLEKPTYIEGDIVRGRVELEIDEITNHAVSKITLKRYIKPKIDKARNPDAEKHWEIEPARTLEKALQRDAEMKKRRQQPSSP
jgi:hypothetical protein